MAVLKRRPWVGTTVLRDSARREEAIAAVPPFQAARPLPCGELAAPPRHPDPEVGDEPLRAGPEPSGEAADAARRRLEPEHDARDGLMAAERAGAAGARRAGEDVHLPEEVVVTRPRSALTALARH